MKRVEMVRYLLGLRAAAGAAGAENGEKTSGIINDPEADDLLGRSPFRMARAMWTQRQKADGEKGSGDGGASAEEQIYCLFLEEREKRRKHFEGASA